MFCAFTVHDYVLGCVYLCMWAVALVDTYKLFILERKKFPRSPARLQWKENEWCLRYFFISLNLQCLFRSVGFFLSPTFLPCKRCLIGAGPPWLDVIVNIPAAFEISTFSALTRAFAASYHLILKEGPRSRRSLRIVTLFLLAVNVTAYILLGIAFTGFGDKDANEVGTKFYHLAVMGVSIASGFLGIVFMVYGALIMTVRQNMVRINEQYRDRPLTQNPLSRMTLIALVCATCFFARSIVLLTSILMGYDVQSKVYSSALYFTFCEVLPSGLMLYLFEKRLNKPLCVDDRLDSEQSNYLEEEDEHAERTFGDSFFRGEGIVGKGGFSRNDGESRAESGDYIVID